VHSRSEKRSLMRRDLGEARACRCHSPTSTGKQDMQKSRLSWLMAVFLGISLSACGGGGGSDSSSGVTPPPSNGGGVVVPPGDNNPGPNPGNPGDDGDHGGDDGHDGGDNGGDTGGGDNGGDDGGNDDGDAPIAEKPVVLETRPAENMRNVDPDANISIV